MTASYSVSIARRAEKELRNVPRSVLGRMVKMIQALGARPRPFGGENLSGEDRYRIRVGDWRIVYGIDDDRKIVTVVKIGHRREIYR